MFLILLPLSQYKPEHEITSLPVSNEDLLNHLNQHRRQQEPSPCIVPCIVPRPFLSNMDMRSFLTEPMYKTPLNWLELKNQPKKSE